MNYKEFQEKSIRTLARLDSNKSDLAHMVLGICTEISELEEAVHKGDTVGIGEELADMQWYISNYNNLLNREYVQNDSLNTDDISTLINLLYSQCSLLQDLVKKYLAYNKPINSITETSLLDNIDSTILSIYNKYGISVSECMEKNINKLKERYPEKFDEDCAINRNIIEERRILES